MALERSEGVEQYMEHARVRRTIETETRLSKDQTADQRRPHQIDGAWTFVGTLDEVLPARRNDRSQRERRQGVVAALPRPQVDLAAEGTMPEGIDGHRIAIRAQQPQPGTEIR